MSVIGILCDKNSQRKFNAVFEPKTHFNDSLMENRIQELNVSDW